MNSNLVRRLQDRIARHQDARRRRNLPQPSFHAKMAERKRLAERVRKLRGLSSGPIYEIETKTGQKEVAKTAGIAAAEVLQGPYATLDWFDLDALPEKFVLKPIIGSGGNGVFLLEKAEGGLRDMISGKHYPYDLNSLQVAGLAKFEGCDLIAEEFIGLENSPSLNWKFHTFFGEIGLIRQGDLSHEGKPYKLWSPEGENLGPIDSLGFPYDPDLPPPNNLDALLQAAQTISLNIMTPFVRVDLYEADDGVRLGEVTFRPSSLWKRKHLQKFTPEWDRKLGVMWEEAQARLIERVGGEYMP